MGENRCLLELRKMPNIITQAAGSAALLVSQLVSETRFYLEMGDPPLKTSPRESPGPLSSSLRTKSTEKKNLSLVSATFQRRSPLSLLPNLHRRTSRKTHQVIRKLFLFFFFLTELNSSNLPRSSQAWFSPLESYRISPHLLPLAVATSSL